MLSQKAWFGYGWGTCGVGTWKIVKTQWLGIKNHQKVFKNHQKPSKIIKIGIFHFLPKYAKNTYFRTEKYALCTENYALFTGYTFGTGQIRRKYVFSRFFRITPKIHNFQVKSHWMTTKPGELHLKIQEWIKWIIYGQAFLVCHCDSCFLSQFGRNSMNLLLCSQPMAPTVFRVS